MNGPSGIRKNMRLNLAVLPLPNYATNGAGYRTVRNYRHGGVKRENKNLGEHSYYWCHVLQWSEA
jgi:hypothetical protein